MVCMMIQGVIFFLLTLAIQLRLWKRLPGCLQKVLRLQDKSKTMTSDEKEDEDVARERKRVMGKEGRGNGDEVLLVKELIKT